MGRARSIASGRACVKWLHRNESRASLGCALASSRLIRLDSARTALPHVAPASCRTFPASKNLLFPDSLLAFEGLHSSMQIFGGIQESALGSRDLPGFGLVSRSPREFPDPLFTPQSPFPIHSRASTL